MKLNVDLKNQGKKCSGCPALHWQPVYHYVCKAGYYGKFGRNSPRRSKRCIKENETKTIG